METKNISENNKLNINITFFIYLIYVVLVSINDVSNFVCYYLMQAGIDIPKIIIMGLLCILLIKIRNKFVIEKDEINTFSILFAVIILCFGLIKLPLPDLSFDTLNYHIFLQNVGFLDNIDSNFFPCGFWTFSFPLGDRLFSLFSWGLGYRAGTILNIFVYLVIYFQINSLIQNYSIKYEIKISKLVISLASFLVVSSEYLLLNLSTYMIDLLYLPFILEMLRIILFDIKYSKWLSYYIGFLFGISVAFKITNIIFVTILILIYLIKFTKNINLRTYLVSTIIAIIPGSIYLIYNYLSTGNPIFPFYNTVFDSIYFPDVNFKDQRWNPRNLLEYIAWPIYIFLAPERCSELAIYSGRMSIAYILIIAVLLFIWLDKRFKDEKLYFMMSIIFIASLLLWVLTTGYIRYALFIEIIAALVILLSAHTLIKQRNLYYKLFGCLIIIFFVLQCATCYYYILIKNMDWAWRPSVVQNSKIYLNNIPKIFNDKKALSDTSVLDNIEVWGVTGYNSGYEILLKKSVPIFDMNLMFMNREQNVNNLFISYLEKIDSKRIFTITTCGQFEDTIITLNSLAFKVIDILIIEPNFIANGEKLCLLEIRRSNETNETNEYLILDNEQKPIVININNNINNGIFSCVLGNTPITYNWGSDGCRILVDLLNGDKVKNIYNQYITPEDYFKQISIKLNGDDLMGDDIKIRLRIINDPGKNGDGDSLSIINPTIKNLEDKNEKGSFNTLLQ